MPEDVAVLTVGFIGFMGLLFFIEKNVKAVNELNFHRHGSDGLSLPRTRDGELIHTLDGISGWY